jgi:predicted  nucleic acid-binding Zn-ribbon protein
MTEILSRLQEMQNETNALRVPQAHLSICAHLSRQIKSRKELTQRVRTAAAELRSVLHRCVNGDSRDENSMSAEAAHSMSVEDISSQLQQAISSLQRSASLGLCTQSALADDGAHALSQQPATAEGSCSAHISSELRLTLHDQIEALLQLPQSVLDKLPS